MENAPQPVPYGRISATLTAAGPVITLPAQPGVSVLIDGRQFERWALRQLRDSLFAAPESKPAAEATYARLAAFPAPKQRKPAKVAA